MSDEQTTTETPEATSDKDKNFAALRQQLDQAQAEIEALRPLRTKETLRQAGFDPDTAEGKALSLAIDAGRVEPDPTQIVEFAGSEFGWEPRTQLTETEATQAEGSKRLEAVRQVTQSDGPSDVGSQIAEAEQAGDWSRAMALKLRRMAGT